MVGPMISIRERMLEGTESPSRQRGDPGFLRSHLVGFWGWLSFQPLQRWNVPLSKCLNSFGEVSWVECGKVGARAVDQQDL